ncbi:acetylxylan esterase precursor [Cordyceps fumosorosea ARSEF 2679]|uniref:Acetylxylan esterase n=1 Tax=Cordyceps fumosorosea (strain ARSEF 2679) TaxID=1081104 RepID=A0A167MR81_CORFA|nr:acetylxylan esterase precursor [Cordyceps fumosorosea ARSEF 2679]OAA54666.1 acetylxylan esterase precursor [Cordyceps fumosorosea ARSEF 2679]
MRTATLSAAALLAGSAMAAECSQGLHILVGRGTGEAAGLGETGALAKNISALVPDSDIVAIDYPATLSDPSYDVSEKDGAKDVYNKVTQYHKDCPGHKMAYLGWSQGAQIAINAFCGGQGGLFGTDAAIPADAVQDVVAIAIFGDPSFNHTAPYVKGTSTADGLFVRNGIGACANFTNKIVSFCDTGDVYCSSGQNRSVHGLYLVNYPKEMINFVVSGYNKATGSNVGGGNSTVTTASPTASSSASVSGGSSSQASPTSSTSPTATNNKNAAAGLSTGLMYAVPVALGVAAQMLL